MSVSPCGVYSTHPLSSLSDQAGPPAPNPGGDYSGYASFKSSSKTSNQGESAADTHRKLHLVQGAPRIGGASAAPSRTLSRRSLRERFGSLGRLSVCRCSFEDRPENRREVLEHNFVPEAQKPVPVRDK